MGNLFLSLLFLLGAWVVKGIQTFSVEHAPTLGASYGRCREDLSGQNLLVVYGDHGEVLAAYDSAGVSLGPYPQLESCASLTKRQFRRELRYRRLLD